MPILGNRAVGIVPDAAQIPLEARIPIPQIGPIEPAGEWRVFYPRSPAVYRGTSFVKLAGGATADDVALVAQTVEELPWGVRNAMIDQGVTLAVTRGPLSPPVPLAAPAPAPNGESGSRLSL